MIPGDEGCSHGKYGTLTVFFDDDTDGTSGNGKNQAIALDVESFKGIADYFLSFLSV